MGSVVNFTYQWPDYGDEIGFFVAFTLAFCAMDKIAFCPFTLASCAMDKIAFFEEWLSLSDLFVWDLIDPCGDLLLKIAVMQ